MTRIEIELQINNAIRANSRREITGEILKRILLLITSSYLNVADFETELQTLIDQNTNQDNDIDSIATSLAAIYALPNGFLKIENNLIASTDLVDGGEF